MLCTSGFIITITCLGLELSNMSRHGYGIATRDLWTAGFHPVDLLSLIIPSSNLLRTVLLANSPQLFVSILYLLYNSIFTSMLLAEEWSSYGTCHLPLRVSQPRGVQRSTYWLHLPYKYAVPLIVSSSLLHWLVSQAIFVARIAVYLDGEEITKYDIVGYGYSSLALVSVLLLGSLMTLAVVLAASTPFSNVDGPPIAGSCSIAIASACHPLGNEGKDVAEQPIAWGVVAIEDESIGHCSFSEQPVTAPKIGRLYA